MKKEGYLFIVNPVAGKNKGLKIIPHIQKKCTELDVPFLIVQTEKPNQTTMITMEYLKRGFSAVVAVGGDGTINEVLNGIGSKKVKLGILPCGTGNDLARSLKIPMEPEEALELIFRKSALPIDRGKAYNKYFLNIASIGLDAEIADYTNKIKRWVKGPSAYIIAMIKTLITYRPIEIQMKLENQIIRKKVMLVAVCNGSYYGGGMKIAPNASLIDGMFDICVIEKMSKMRLLYLFPEIFKGAHIKEPEVTMYRTASVEIKGRLKGKANIDGEIISLPIHHKTGQSQLKIQLEQKKLSFLGKEVAYMEVAN